MHDAPPVPPEDARRAFDELARITLSDHSVESVLDKVAHLARTAVPGVADASVTVLDRGRATTVASTGELATTLDQAQYDRDEGPCLEAARRGVPVELADVRTSDRWADYCATAAGHGALSSLSLPLAVPQRAAAGLNLYARTARAFDDESRALATSFASYAAVAVTNMHLYESSKRLSEQLEQAMASRSVIEQAKGILMAQYRCSPDAAFDRLVDISQRTNRRLREVAQQLVEAVGSG